MPELPEVEVTRRQLLPLLVGRTIAEVRTTRDSYFFITPPATLRRRLRGRRFVGLDRVGKYLLARLDSGERLLLHLGMTGQIFAAGVASVRLLVATAGSALEPQAQQARFQPDAHTHLWLRFADSGRDVFFRDSRKFGKVQLLAPEERSPRLDRLGPDALAVTGPALRDKLRKRHSAVKSALLDQSVLAGVGNIYADEALFIAGIRPTRRAARVSLGECEGLAAAVRRVLLRSIETGGSSISDYVQPDGSDGSYQDERRVYGREAEPCLVCAAPIRRRVIGQRASHFCPGCQR